MKKRIVIAEYVSTGYNMVYDVLSRCCWTAPM